MSQLETGGVRRGGKWRETIELESFNGIILLVLTMRSTQIQVEVEAVAVEAGRRMQL